MERDPHSIQQDYESLNEDQQRIVSKVVNAVNRNERINMMVSGEGGTGKTRVIHVISVLISSQHSNTVPVVVAAPTGLAAFNVGGTTIHRTLSLPIEHGKPSDYRRLNMDDLTTIRATRKGLKLLIVDEISMVSSLTLLFIHLRLTEIMTNNTVFGGLSTVFVFQLPPVKGNQPFLPVTFLETKQRLGAVGSLDIWPELTYDELTINVRQNGDKQYAEILSSIRVGQLTDVQYQLLQSRLISPDHQPTIDDICNRYDDLVATGESTVILMARSTACRETNDAMLQRTGATIYQLPASDTLDTIVSSSQLQKVKAAYSKIASDVTRTAGLETNLQLCIGAKVMLKRNIQVELGLVNGAVGQVVGFNMQESKVQKVLIKFEKIC